MLISGDIIILIGLYFICLTPGGIKATQSGQNQKKMFWPLDMFLTFQNLHRLELRNSFIFCVANLPVKKGIRIRFNIIPVFLILDIDV